MHIPDNYLSPSTCAVMGAVMVPVWAIASAKIKKEITVKKIPLLGISAAFSFLVMMLNIPLPGGTTGHAVGSSLIAILLGPFSACLTVTIALLIQALFFGDGGILAFGANCFNMAFVMPFATYFIFRILSSALKNEKGKVIAAFVSSYLALNIAAFFAAVEFGLQPLLFKDASGLPMYCPYPLNISIPAMTIPHLLIAGVVEGIITAGVYSYILKTSPGIINEEKKLDMKPLYILLGTLTVFTPLGLLASGTAWGEWGADEIEKLVKYLPAGMKKGFNFEAIMPDYTIPFLKNEYIGYIISAVLGAALLLILFKIASAFLKKNANDKK
jgi:cobalt/nickel transport system permease protein